MAKNQKIYIQSILNDTDRNGVPDILITLKSVYDHGNLISDLRQYDYGNDGSLNFQQLTENSYHKTGRLITRELFSDSEGDEVWNQKVTANYEYNKNGDIISEVYAYDTSNDDQLDNTYSTYRTYDNKHNILTKLVNRDDDANGTVDYQEYAEYGYNKSGLLIFEKIDYYRNGNVEYLMTTEDIPAEKHQKAYVQTIVHDTDMNGAPDILETANLLYDRGNLVSELRQYDYGADGSNDYGNLTKSTYNKKGQLVQQDFFEDNEGDGIPNNSSTYKFEYSKRGDPIKEITTLDEDGDEVANHFFQVDRTFSKDHKVLTELSIRDFGNDGVIDEQDYYTYSWDKDGLLIGQTIDYGANGSLEYVLTTEILLA